MAPRVLNKLSARAVVNAKKPGRYGDGGGLYLVVSPAGSRKWVFRYTWNGRLRDMGLGSALDGAVSLSAARIAAASARAQVRNGQDPIHARAQSSVGAAPTFGAFADELVAEIEPGFRNAKHRAQWKMTLRVYAAPIRPKLVDQVTTEDVLGVLKPIWRTKPETASRVRGRIERVLDAAKARGYRAGDNPARWRGHLALLLPKPAKLARGHHAALGFSECPKFSQKIRAAEGVAARALEFTILTVARTEEALGARRIEFDLEAKVWTVPGGRMKSGREHRVPLSERAVDIIRSLPDGGPHSYLFPGVKPGRPLSSMAMTLRRLNPDVTVHGFRSTFSDWAGECTSFPREIVEVALSHVVGDETERAYRRGDALEKRRELMSAWALYCGGTTDNVVPLATAGVRR